MAPNEGSVITAADVSRGKTEQLLVGGELERLNLLPAYHLSVTLHSRQTIDPLRRIDTLFFQGSHPGTRSYLFYSTLSTTKVNSSIETERPFYEAHLDTSWLVKGVAS
jgi:hypothetical protein